MKTGFVLFILFAMVFLIFGCLGSTPPETGGNGQDDEGTGIPSDGQGTGMDLSGKTYQELVDLDLPIRCEIRYIDESTGKGAEDILYIKGSSSKATLKNPDLTQQCQLPVLTLTSEMIYTGCDRGFYSEDCDYSSMSLSSQDDYSEQISESIMESFNDLIEKDDVDCQVGVFGDEVFEPPSTARVCSLDDLFNQELEGG